MADLAALLKDAWLDTLRGQKRLGDHALAQLSDEHLHERLAPGLNPIAVIVKHLAGSQVSRWTDFLTSDGEKPGRGREGEFVDDGADKAEMLARWERGWAAVFDAVGSLTPDDLTRTVTIRGEPHTVPLAVSRAINHHAYHLGQILMIARTLVERGGGEWRWGTIAPGESERFTRDMRARHADGAGAGHQPETPR